MQTSALIDGTAVILCVLRVKSNTEMLSMKGTQQHTLEESELFYKLLF